MSFLSDLLTGGAGTVINAVAKGVDLLTTSDQERLAAENELQRIGLEETQAYLQDTANARDANARIQESEHASLLAKNVGYWLDLFIVATTVALAYLVLFQEVPTANKELFYTAFGSLITMCMTVVNFHRSSTVSSKRKDDTISLLSKGQP